MAEVDLAPSFGAELKVCRVLDLPETFADIAIGCFQAGQCMGKLTIWP